MQYSFQVLKSSFVYNSPVSPVTSEWQYLPNSTLRTPSLSQKQVPIEPWSAIKDKIYNVDFNHAPTPGYFAKHEWKNLIRKKLGVSLLSESIIPQPKQFKTDFNFGHIDFDLGLPSHLGLKGQALLQAVARDARKGFQVKTYSEARTAIFSTIDNVVINGVHGVYSSYSDIFVPGTFGQGSKYKEQGDQNGDGRVDNNGMNVEHLWPQSYFNKRSPMRSDLHHLFSTFMYPNNQRGRLPFGEVEDEDIVYQTNAGAKASTHLFEPPDQVKGQVARALCYFYTRYRKRDILPSNAVDEFWNNSLPTLMRWNLDYPPGEWELKRNNRIENFQGNRNPFVDDHTLIERIGLEAFKL